MKKYLNLQNVITCIGVIVSLVLQLLRHMGYIDISLLDCFIISIISPLAVLGETYAVIIYYGLVEMMDVFDRNN
ncbi:MAG: hypothetical protein CK539_06380 [Flavobacteriales bacterium]|nr:MAG: hypothetical protein CK539_06380 [Flavobacteriales bacterium]